MVCKEINADLDLMLLPDSWLDNQVTTLKQQLMLLSEQLSGLETARQAKISLQQKNMVVVRFLAATRRDILACPIGDAIRLLCEECSDQTIPKSVSVPNVKSQVETWLKDGYDIAADDLASIKKL